VFTGFRRLLDGDEQAMVLSTHCLKTGRPCEAAHENAQRHRPFLSSTSFGLNLGVYDSSPTVTRKLSNGAFSCATS
jgi:hypothetical protein